MGCVVGKGKLCSVVGIFRKREPFPLNTIFLRFKRDCSAAATDLERHNTEEKDLIASQCPSSKYLSGEETWPCGRFRTTGKRLIRTGLAIGLSPTPNQTHIFTLSRIVDNSRDLGVDEPHRDIHGTKLVRPGGGPNPYPGRYLADKDLSKHLSMLPTDTQRATSLITSLPERTNRRAGVHTQRISVLNSNWS